MLKFFIITFLALLLLSNLSKAEGIGGNGNLGFDQMEFIRRVRTVAEEKGLRIGSMSITRCGASTREEFPPYFCDTHIFTLRAGMYSHEQDGLLSAVSLFPAPYSSLDEFTLGISFVIAVMDPTLSEIEIANLAERLTRAGRMLSGMVTASGPSSKYMAFPLQHRIMFLAERK